MMRRRQLLASIRSRVDEFIATGRPDEILGQDAFDDAAALRRMRQNPAADLEAAYTAGILMWLRYLARSAGEDEPADERDLLIAASLFSVVTLAEPAKAPRELSAAIFDIGRLDPHAVTRLLIERHQGNDAGKPGALLRYFEDVLSPDPSIRTVLLSRFSDLFRGRYDRTGYRPELTAAIETFRRILGLLTTGHPDRVRLLINLSSALRLRSAWSVGRQDMDEADDLLAEAARLIPAGHDLLPQVLYNQASLLLERAARTDAPELLDDAVDLSRKSVRQLGPGSPDRHQVITGLGIALRRRYSRTGHAADLTESIEVHRQALAAAPPGHGTRPDVLGNLAAALQDRYRLSGALSDLDAALEAAQEAVDTAPPDSPQIGTFLSNLAGVYRALEQRTGNPAALDEAITVLRRAAEATPPPHPNSGPWLQNLAMSLETRFSLKRQAADHDEALRIQRQALAAAELSDNRAELPKIRAMLAVVLLTEYERSRRVEDLAEAEEGCRAALAAMQPYDPGRLIPLFGLAAVLQQRFKDSGTDPDRLAASAALLRAAQLPTAPVPIRLLTASQMGRLNASSGDWRRASEGFALAVELLPRLAPRPLNRSDQEYWLGRVQFLADDAAACAVAAGDPDRAVELLELGRGVLLAQILELRGDVDALRDAHPQLAEQFIDAREKLDRIVTTQRPEIRAAMLEALVENAATADLRRTATEAFERLIERIRQVPGFERFLRPQPITDLISLAADGPVVFVNTSIYRTDALALTAHGVRVIPLPEIDGPQTVGERAVAFFTAVTQSHDHHATLAVRDRAQQRVRAELAWLWDAVTGPVLQALGHTREPAPGQPWPRVWWSPVGLLGYLPLHAAGHDTDPANQALDLVVSSYTPTVRALRHARRPVPPGPADLLVVAMPNTPGGPPLPAAEREATLLAALRPGARVLGTATGATGHATREAVLVALPEHGHAHFACHGRSDMRSPSESLLYVEDHEQQPLRVLDVTGLLLDHAEFAYLSACETVQTSPDLADEAIHLATAFQLAGYRHVIGTLWTVQDDAAYAIAENVYNHLGHGDAGDRARFATALHHALRDLRRRFPRAPSLWAAHVHIGP
jgi:hypothetical protein